MSTLDGSHTQSATYAELSQCARAEILEVEACELAKQLGSTIQLLDVRDFDETATGVIEGALVTPRGRLEKLVETMGLDHQADVVLYCESGKRSALAARTLGSMGFLKVRSLAGGIEAWRDAGHPVRTGTMELAAPVQGGGDQACTSVVLSDWDSIRSDYPITTARIECTDGLSRPLIYLDHAATTHPPATALQAYMQFLGLEYSNVHRATHSLARSATDRFEKAYGTCADFIGGNLDEGCVIFTANTTHACDLVAHVVAHLPGKVVVTDLEHHSNDLPHRGRSEVVRIGLDDQMCLDMAALEEVLRTEEVKLVAITGAANVTGWMPPIHEIAELAHRHGALICVDGAQLMAHAPVDVRPHDDPGHIDFITAAGHKMYAPFGIGFLYGPRALFDEAPPYLPGGGTAAKVEADSVEWLPSPDRHQGGTPNVAGVIGLASVIDFLTGVGMERVRKHEQHLLSRAWNGLSEMEGITIYGPDAFEDRVGILPFNVDGVSDLLCSAVLGAEYAIAVRNGRFCAHVHADTLFEAQGGVTEESDVRPGAVRVSFGLFNNEHDVDRFLEAVRRVRDREWVGQYEIKGGDVDTKSAGRCADAWMESTKD